MKSRIYFETFLDRQYGIMAGTNLEKIDEKGLVSTDTIHYHHHPYRGNLQDSKELAKEVSSQVACFTKRYTTTEDQDHRNLKKMTFIDKFRVRLTLVLYRITEKADLMSGL